MTDSATDQRVLYIQAAMAHDAAKALLGRLREMAPRESDYPDRAQLEAALAYHDGRVGSVERVRIELEDIAHEIAQRSAP